MLKIEKEVKLTQTKFQEGNVYPLRNQQIFISLQTNTSSHMDESDSISKKYSSQTYVFRSIDDNFRKFKNLKIMDLSAEKIEQSQNQSGLGLIISNFPNELQQYSGNIINFHKIKDETKISRILSNQKYASFDYNRKNITIDSVRASYNVQSESRTQKRESNIIYSIPINQQQNSILSLQKLDQTRLIFHVGQCRQDEEMNKQLKCYDLIHQAVAWKFNMPRYYSMTNRIVKVSENTFMNGIADFNTSIVLKLFDLRVNGAVANMLSYQGEAVELLQGQWNGRGFLGLNFDFLLKTNTQFQFLGIIGISLGSLNFPYFFDLRRPEEIQPLGFPNGPYFKHLKALQICEQNIFALQREYHNFSFRQCRLSFSHIAYD